MPFINITTNNLSRGVTNSPTFEDNWVYIPGTAITGDWSKPVALHSLDEFKSKFGTYSPDGSQTFEYVSGILSSGLPVLFQRIACVGQADIQWSNGTPILPSEVERAECASCQIKHYIDTETQVLDMTVYEKYGGTFGNSMTVRFRESSNTIWLDIKYKNTLLEKYKIITFKGNEDLYARNLAFINAVNNTEFDRISISIPVDTSVEAEVLQFAIPVSEEDVALSGGTDFDEGKVVAEIPSLIYPTLVDKILYLPKFITSGGYVDEATNDDIGTAMKNLTEARQDCRALIDLPLGTLRSDYQGTANKYAYYQLAGNTVIPSASMCGPWVYTQLGNTQLWMPPSFTFLTLMGDSISKGDKPYTPKAGLSSGRLYNIIKPEFEIGSDIAEKWQSEGSVNINPIMRLQSGDYVIAGNSTLLTVDEDEVNAFTESSADLAVIEIRRFIYNLGTELQYQYNSATAFENFSLRTSNYLNRMGSDGTVTDYTIQNISTEDDPRTLRIKVNVWVAPTIKAIEINLNVAYGSITMSSGGEA